MNIGFSQPFVGENSTQVNSEFAIKGFHLDLRIQVMTPQALREFADELSALGMNTLVMEWEGTYPYKSHATIANEFSYTEAEISDFIAYCENLKINVIPLQQSLGHVEYILRNQRYTELKEDRKDISQLCPMEVEANRALFSDLFSELAATHNSDYIHIGGDETYLLGHCEKCKAKVEKVGKSKLFVDHMKLITELVIAAGKKPVMWADIILKHPESASELPKETIFIDWNYGWRINHFGDVPGLQEKGFTFWGSPSIRSHPDNWYVTDWTTHFKNQKEFIPYGREAGYKGMVMTSWSTTGVYGFTWDVNYDVIDMEQVRNTYPMSGFRILIASYAEALNQEEPVNPEAFVLRYGKERFGLLSQEAEVMRDFIFAKPELVKNGAPERSENVAEMQRYFNDIRVRINKVKPKKNVEEFEHFKLMADLRMHYLDFKKVEEQYNSEDFSISKSALLVKDLDKVLKDAKKLNKRFFKLNKGFLYDSELHEQNELRVQPVRVLRKRLAKIK
ncbi:Glycosyl hydrolase family 20, catalytic domain [Spirosomataceae bacterium TFI 002]|nr:Glycosyl hydrolase family 20, catalytic domain [Spirosomataceae bacterium TFI 002]